MRHVVGVEILHHNTIIRELNLQLVRVTNTTNSQPPIGREPVGIDSVRYRTPDRPRWGRPLF